MSEIASHRNPESASGLSPTSLEFWAASLELAVVVDPEGKILEVNRAFARKFGHPNDSWKTERLADLVHPEDADDHKARAALLRRPPFHISREHRWRTAQGWRWIGWEETALRDERGEVIGVRAIGRDVTKHRLAEEHFRKISQAVEQAPVSVIITTPGGTPQYVNSRFTEVTGYTLENIFEHEIPLLRDGHPSEASYRECCQRLANGGKWSGELKTQRRDGSSNWELVRNSPIRNHVGEITNILCLREDISERKALEEQLRHSQKMEDLGKMVGGISHDFNNIISIVRGYSEMALALPDLEPRLERYVRAMADAALRASSLVEQIMVFSRKNAPRFRPVHIHRLAEEFIGFFRETFPRNIEFEHRFDAAVDVIAADPDQLRQLFVNLCVNARDAMPKGGTLTVATRLVPGAEVTGAEADPARDYLCISISDTGKGMPEEVCQRIFEPFYTTKGESKGTGLGLAVVHSVVSNHDGMVAVKSAPGEGAEFQIHLPLRAPEAEAVLAADETRGLGVPAGTERLLVVEDEAPIQELLSIAFRDAGYQVDLVADGEAAVDVLIGERETYDVVLLDLNMPRFSGVEVLRLLRAQGNTTPVVVISGHLTLEVRSELDELQPAALMAKPFDLGGLGRVVREVLDRPS